VNTAAQPDKKGKPGKLGKGINFPSRGKGKGKGKHALWSSFGREIKNQKTDGPGTRQKREKKQELLRKVCKKEKQAKSERDPDLESSLGKRGPYLSLRLSGQKRQNPKGIKRLGRPSEDRYSTEGAGGRESDATQKCVNEAR